MLQSFECPNCQATLDYDANANSLTVRCSYCGSTVIVPDSLRGQRRSSSGQEQVLAEIVQLVQNGRKIEAIKRFRETFNVGLKEAKDVVEAIERHEDIHLGGTSFHTESVSISSYTTTPPVQTSSGRGGCVVFLVALVLIAVGAAAFFVIVPASQSDLIEQITSITESESGGEINVSINEDDVIGTIEAIIPGQGPENGRQAAEGPAFAEVILQFGGEEGVG
ncbi:MAG: hypothetical protein CL608_19055, partial [Anaerolineaceae bacterium]|nr:hypothetical protein [Anaerolineaceae bacterium]